MAGRHQVNISNLAADPTPLFTGLLGLSIFIKLWAFHAPEPPAESATSIPDADDLPTINVATRAALKASAPPSIHTMWLWSLALPDADGAASRPAAGNAAF